MKHSTSVLPRLHAALCQATLDQATIVSEVRLAHGSDLRLGTDSTATWVLPDWTGPSVLLISGDGLLHLGAGMRVNMCGDLGVGRVVGTYEELVANGVTLPIPIMMRRMNIRIREGMSVFAKYVDDQGDPLKSEVEDG